LVSKCAAAISVEDARSYLEPLQLALSRRGAEARVHAMQAFYDDHLGQQVAVLQLDLENAYNCISHNHMLQQLLIVAPGVARYCYWKYVRPSKLTFGSYIIESTECSDPMSPMLFALGMHVLIKEVRECWPTLFSGAYMDDWDLGGPPEELNRAFSYILKRGPEIGCYLNPGKCCVVLLNGTDLQDMLLGVPQVLNGNFKCLKSPIGDRELCRKIAKEVQKHTGIILHAITKLSDLHAAYFLLKYCTGYPFMVYLMCTVPSCTIMDILEEFDDMSRHTFSEIFTFARVDVITWCEISLPTCKGGLSLRTTTDHASTAYLASVDGCYQMVSHLCPNYTPVALSESVHDYNNRTSAMHMSAEGFPYVNTPLVQKELSAGIEHDILDEVIRNATLEKKSKIIFLTGTWYFILAGVPSR